ncbi:MAG: aminotransferase class I/II-fold pyridoxal phosphate-dependent enzyme [Microbacterium sp.]
MTAAELRAPESARVRRMHIPARSSQIGTTVREADLSLRLDGGGDGLLDTTHFDTVRFPPPAWAAEVMAEAIADGATAYTPYRGAPDVLDDLASNLTEFLGAPVSPANLALTPGTQGGLFATLSAIVDEGDVVLLADPEYLFTERMLEFLGARVVRIPISVDSDEPSLDLDAIEAALALRPSLLVFSHPNNPSGAVFPRRSLERIASLAVEHGFRILADELYSRLVYPDADYVHMRTLPGMAERCITMLGPSKTESLSGFRLGIVVGPEDVMSAVEQTLAVTALRAPAYGQRLLSKWLVADRDFVAQRVIELAHLRDMTVEALRRVPGLKVVPQRGTAYLYCDATALGASDVDIARVLQVEAGVVVSPGYQFGPSGVGRFRVCYARDEIEWAGALERMVEALTGLGLRAGSRSEVVDA